MAEQKPSDFNVNDSSDAVDNEPHTHPIMISPEDAATIKSQLFELCKQGDIDENDKISFNEFASVIKKFLPNATDKGLHEMFSTFDDNHDGSISYVKFLSDHNFNKFLNYCGYITTNQATQSNEDIPNLTRSFSIHNDHDKQIILAQQEVISKLNTWITDIGKASQLKCEELQIQNDALNQEVSGHTMQLDAIKHELNTINEEKKAIQNEHESAMTHKNILSEKLKGIKQALTQSKDALKTYYKLETKWKETEKENKQLTKENVALKLKVEEELLIIDNLQNETTQLKEASATKLHAMKSMHQESDELEDIITDFQDELKESRDTVTAQNKEIAHLREKLGILATHGHNGDSEQNEATIRMFHQVESTLDRTQIDDLTEFAQAAVSFPDSVRSVNHWHEAEAAEWNKVREQMKIENERLKNELITLKEAHALEIQQLIERHEYGFGHKENLRIVSANEDENAPFINPVPDYSDKNEEKYFDPFLCCKCKLFRFRLW